MKLNYHQAKNLREVLFYMFAAGICTAVGFYILMVHWIGSIIIFGCGILYGIAIGATQTSKKEYYRHKVEEAKQRMYKITERYEEHIEKLKREGNR